MNPHIITTIDEGILTIRITRPEKKNALTLAMYAALADAIRGAGDDESVCAIILTGADGAFSAGNDLNDFLSVAATGLSGATPILAFIESLARARKPLIAAVDGVAVGIGSTLLLHCDFVYASPSSLFRFPFVDLGLVPEAGSSLLLPALAGRARAAELLMLGDAFDSATAERIGLVTAVVEPDALLPRAMETARRLSAKPQAALLATKALLRSDADAVMERVMTEARAFDTCLRTPELREAVTAFREGRKPDFARARRGG
ncbi:enoyl-CoA hydratase [Azospirillum sp. RWY-5-1]|uniref:Enoyl-CoA hydratase n=1 Tax=Azospirillum oleiclasticum TaxID=2735135 RepID=A0ABX2T8X3_9PROT|nr:enoyl-CoA hydratase [Azospirillum oleiclasticum]NYZ13585.1 enoyl-CoA hydratase [Azospirillum oleiclasticum]NYZ20745.1 enoyl-CoA hydratase [Azospirillum oleiclasticum]